jgi:hypothetical protein
VHARILSRGATALLGDPPYSPRLRGD